MLTLNNPSPRIEPLTEQELKGMVFILSVLLSENDWTSNKDAQLLQAFIDEYSTMKKQLKALDEQNVFSCCQYRIGKDRCAIQCVTCKVESPLENSK